MSCEPLVPTRRSFITGLIAAVAAPAIVRPASLMPVKLMVPSAHRWIMGYEIGSDLVLVRADFCYSYNKVGRVLPLTRPYGVVTPDAALVRYIERKCSDMLIEADRRAQLGEWTHVTMPVPSSMTLERLGYD